MLRNPQRIQIFEATHRHETYFCRIPKGIHEGNPGFYFVINSEILKETMEDFGMEYLKKFLAESVH